MFPDCDVMASIMRAWIEESAAAHPPVGRWAVTLPSTAQGRGVMGGAALLPFGPDGEDLQMAWQLQPTWWGKGLATEAGHALAHYAFAHGAVGGLRRGASPQPSRGSRGGAGRDGVGR